MLRVENDFQILTQRSGSMTEMELACGRERLIESWVLKMVSKYLNFHQRLEADNHENKFVPFCEFDAKSDNSAALLAVLLFYISQVINYCLVYTSHGDQIFPFSTQFLVQSIQSISNKYHISWAFI